MRAILAVAMLLVCISAHSQEPAPTPSINSQQKQPHIAKSNKKPATEPSGTDKKPFVVKSFEPENTPERTEQEKPEREKKSANERSLVFWTIVLAAATIALALIAGGQFWMFWRQLTLMREGANNAKVLTKAAQSSAEAAKTQANALMNSERAYVKMSHTPPGVKIEEDHGLFEVTVEVKNHGGHTCHHYRRNR